MSAEPAPKRPRASGWICVPHRVVAPVTVHDEPTACTSWPFGRPLVDRGVRRSAPPARKLRGAGFCSGASRTRTGDLLGAITAKRRSLALVPLVQALSRALSSARFSQFGSTVGRTGTPSGLPPACTSGYSSGGDREGRPGSLRRNTERERRSCASPLREAERGQPSEPVRDAAPSCVFVGGGDELRSLRSARFS
jgi:hypothetical protein